VSNVRDRAGNRDRLAAASDVTAITSYSWVKAATDAGWSAINVSVVGAGHREEGKSGDDSSSCYHLGENGSFLAVADGAGSSRYAAWASETAIIVTNQTVADFERELLEAHDANQLQSVLAGLMTKIEARFTKELKVRHRATSDALTTLAITLVLEPFICYAGIGDGFWIIQRSNGQFYLPTPIARTGRYHNETSFLGHDPWQDKGFAWVLLDQDISTVALSTDGLEEVFLDFGDPRTGQLAADPFRIIHERISGVVEAMQPADSDLESVALRLGQLMVQPWVGDWSRDDLTLAVSCKSRG
jgi:hypothetical protein